MQQRSSLQDSLLLELEGDPSCGDDKACKSYSSNDAEHKVRQEAATLVNPERMFIMLVKLRRLLSRQIAWDTIEFAYVNWRCEQCKYGVCCISPHITLAPRRHPPFLRSGLSPCCALFPQARPSGRVSIRWLTHLSACLLENSAI